MQRHGVMRWLTNALLFLTRTPIHALESVTALPRKSPPRWLRAGFFFTPRDDSGSGTLCVIDHRPRRVDKLKLALLRDLVELVEQEPEADTQ